MQLYFIRHAQSVNNVLYATTGSSNGRLADPPLTDLGRQQAGHLANFLSQTRPDLPEIYGGAHNVRGFFFTHLYASLMERAVQTGSVVARELGLPLVAWSDIHEVGGLWLPDEEDGEPVGQAGPGRDYFAEHYPELALPDWLEDSGWWNRPFEPVEARPERARRVIEELWRRHGQSDDRVAIISHGGFYSIFMNVLLTLPAQPSPIETIQETYFHLANTAISRLDFVDETMRIVYLNKVNFLPRELVT